MDLEETSRYGARSAIDGANTAELVTWGVILENAIHAKTNHNRML